MFENSSLISTSQLDNNNSDHSTRPNSDTIQDNSNDSTGISSPSTTTIINATNNNNTNNNNNNNNNTKMINPHLPLNPTMNKIFSIKSQSKNHMSYENLPGIKLNLASNENAENNFSSKCNNNKTNNNINNNNGERVNSCELPKYGVESNELELDNVNKIKYRF